MSACARPESLAAYLLPLKSLSNRGDATPYVRAMAHIHKWTDAFDYAQPRHMLYEALKRSNAFEEYLRNFRLVFPEANTGAASDRSRKPSSSTGRLSCQLLAPNPTTTKDWAGGYFTTVKTTPVEVVVALLGK